MSSDVIPDEVRRFVAACIDEVPQLEALLLLRGRPDHALEPQEVAARIYVGTREAEAVLRALCERGLLVERELPEAAVGYAYAPRSLALGSAVDLLADAYAKHLVELTQMIHAKRPSGARAFADAFRVR